MRQTFRSPANENFGSIVNFGYCLHEKRPLGADWKRKNTYRQTSNTAQFSLRHLNKIFAAVFSVLFSHFFFVFFDNDN